MDRKVAIAATAAIAVVVAGSPQLASAHAKSPSRPTGLRVVGISHSSFTVALSAAAHAAHYRLYASTNRSDRNASRPSTIGDSLLSRQRAK